VEGLQQENLPPRSVESSWWSEELTLSTGAPVVLVRSAVLELAGRGAALSPRCTQREVHPENTLYQDTKRRRTGRPVEGTARISPERCKNVGKREEVGSE